MTDELINMFDGIQVNDNLSVEDYIKLKGALTRLDNKFLEKSNKLCKMTQGGKYESYNTIDKVLKRIVEDNSDKIFIYVEDMDKYLLFDNEDIFVRFIMDVCPAMVEGRATKSDFVKYQVITTDKKQKLILAYDTQSKDIQTDLVKQAKEYFKVNSNILYNTKWDLSQLMVDVVIDNYDENGKYCLDFYNHLEQCKIGYGQGLKRPPVLNDIVNNKNYIMAKVEHKHTLDQNTVKLSLPTCTSIIINNNGGIVNININNITNNITKKSLDRGEETIKFITNNPPTEREKTSDYGKRYKEHCKSIGILPYIRDFNAYVRAQGYSETHSGLLWFWTKTS
jgi:hypothetical protein